MRKIPVDPHDLFFFLFILISPILMQRLVAYYVDLWDKEL